MSRLSEKYLFRVILFEIYEYLYSPHSLCQTRLSQNIGYLKLILRSRQNLFFLHIILRRLSQIRLKQCFDKLN
jgi:hypothetical protein